MGLLVFQMYILLGVLFTVRLFLERSEMLLVASQWIVSNHILELRNKTAAEENAAADEEDDDDEDYDDEDTSDEDTSDDDEDLEISSKDEELLHRSTVYILAIIFVLFWPYLVWNEGKHS